MATKEAFFTKGSWDFDDLTRDFKHVIDYIDAEKEIMNAHMVDYFTMNHWETLLSPKLREELEALSSQQLTSLPSLDDLDCDGAEPLGVELNNFISKAKKAQLKSFPWVKDRKDFSSESKLDFISHIMTPKKSYEVEVMSDVINGLAQSFGVNKILDLGSGKGYLSQYLAMQYRLKVIGIDSSDSNTQNAAKRNDRLLKAWKGLSKKSSKEKVDAHRTAPGVHVLFSPSSQPLEPASTQENAKEKDDSHLPQKLSHCLSQVCKHCNSDVDAHGLKKTCSGCSDQLSFTCPCKPEQENSTSEENQATLLSGSAFDSIRTTCNPCEMEQEVFPHICDPFCRCSANWSSVHVQEGVNSTTAHSSLPCASRTGPNFNNVPSDGGVMVGESCHQYSKVPETTGKTMMMPKNQQIQAPNLNSFLPVTGFVNQSFVTSGELTRLFKELNSCDSAIDESNGLFLVGLHTCGNLAPMALRICAREPCVKLLCVVGCCYHTVTQEFRPDNTTGDPGFPMSEFFRQFKPQLSRNATMVAQQAADRIASEAKFPPPSVLYRAILQVILKEKFHMDGRGMHVGKIGAKCKDFKEYVHKACNKLGLKEDELSVGEVESYLERFKSKEKQLHAFHQLRATIAPCIESIFLLDRLCYLYEQNIKSACIVKLFDAVKSPRCYAIIAFRP